VNVMELLVQEEIEAQLKFYPKSLKSYLNTIEVATYALNRLPALYASSTRGKEQQKRFGQQKYKKQITSEVRRALAAIERDPLRKSTPISSEIVTENNVANIALKKLQTFLIEQQLINQNQMLSWHNLTLIMQQVFKRLHPQELDSLNLESQPYSSTTEITDYEIFDVRKTWY
ncbi:MAG: late competence development ComFB family protein, partial [Cyanobacteria bacterium P01_G01_bin.49]